MKAPDAKRANSGWGVDREYQSYDILRSTPQFTKKLFTQIWTEILDFAANATDVARSEPTPQQITGRKSAYHN